MLDLYFCFLPFEFDELEALYRRAMARKESGIPGWPVLVAVLAGDK